MKSLSFAIRPGCIRRVGVRLFQAAALALVLAVALPAMATNQRTVKSMVMPVYPHQELFENISGPIQIDVTVDPNGKVIGVKALNGEYWLAAAAKDAVWKWKFAPASTVTSENVLVKFVLPK